ncbi:MAG: ATP-dependent DNA helicase RecG [Bacteroidales bacterium]|nr:ATP-dependent DNA helicase RecG [Bacteroidales bacterium]MDD3299262.1 ATP-dependent DNA helicase RecG [Bacteroidales bacterium]MDD3843153.1 ATP-dependent DNA helicase RecG [Bacteroidales bacterium]MDD4617963.1 ATP-dependent DNA helicase RecG [Bacteroidales bacterium]
MASILESDIKFLQGVGPRRAEILDKELGIKCFKDMLMFFPFRYIDRSKIYSVTEIDSSMSYIQLRGRISSISVVGDKPRAKRLVAKFWDSTGTLDLVFFQRIKWIKDWLKPNTEYIVFGKPSVFNNSFNMVHPEVEPATIENPGYMGNMMGIYPSTEKLKNAGFSNKQITRLVGSLLKLCEPALSETIPVDIVQKKRLLSHREAINNIHFPKNNQLLAQAQFRLKFEELFYLQLSLLKQKGIREKKIPGIIMSKVGDHFNNCYRKLPFQLTDAQKRVIKEIRSDLVGGRQMNRLLQGDVGSGKTMVAVLSALLAADNGYQSCIMAPTEVLAGQHYKGSLKLLLGIGVKTALLTGSTKKKERESIANGLLDGSIDILFGTHALIEDTVQFSNLGLAVIDEQHRFGVEQRSRLWNKGKTMPHILVMTATPIPRTLAMTLYGDLDVSVIDQLPPGRKPIKTMHATDTQRDRIYSFMKEQINKGRQVFIVYPLIKESEKMDYKNLQDGYMNIIEEFKAPEYITAVVHGKQKNEDKAHDMELFASGKAHILVATSVIEVGVDVPNASVMIIESAERFGLSQLHQLRGRVGRGAEESWCILMTGYKLSKESRQRIELMCSTNDGFELAEADLRMRGPGDMEGTQQSGLPVDLHISNLAKDGQILEEARRTAQAILEEDPLLENEKHRLLRYNLGKLKREQKDYSLIS